jgi:hypothetical protein
MHDPRSVGVIECPRQRFDQDGGEGRLLWLTLEFFSQRAARDVFHDKERLAVMLADLEDLHDVGVLQAGHRFRLLTKARLLFGGGVFAAQDHFQGHDPVDPELACLVDPSHAAVAQHAQDLVTGHDRLPV